MATPYTSVYSILLGKVSDYSFLSLTDTQVDAQLLPILQSATIDFKGCRNSLAMDNTLMQFTADLTYEEQDILASLMILRWLQPMINNTMILKSNLTDKDFQMSSQANQLKSLITLRKDTFEQVKALIRQYTYDDPTALQKLVTTDSYPLVTDYGIGANGWINWGDGNSGQLV